MWGGCTGQSPGPPSWAPAPPAVRLPGQFGGPCQPAPPPACGAGGWGGCHGKGPCGKMQTGQQQGLIGKGNPGCGNMSSFGCNTQAPGMQTPCGGYQSSSAMGPAGCGAAFPAPSQMNFSNEGSFQQGKGHLGCPIVRPSSPQICGNGGCCGGHQPFSAMGSAGCSSAFPGAAQTNFNSSGCFQQGKGHPGCGGASYGCNGCNAQPPSMHTSGCGGGCSSCQGQPAMSSSLGCSSSTFPASSQMVPSTSGNFQQGVTAAIADTNLQGQDQALNSAALQAIQELQGQAGQGSQDVAPVQEAAPADFDAEIKAFIVRFSLDEDLETRTKEALKHRGDKWQADLAELTSCLTRARSPVGFLTVKLNNLEKIIQAETGVNLSSSREFCANFRRGHCTRGDSCRYSHDVATGTEQQAKVAALIEEAKKAAETAASAAGFGGGGGFGAGQGGFGDGQGGFGTSRRVLKKSKPASSSSSRSRKRSRSRGKSKKSRSRGKKSRSRGRKSRSRRRR